MKFIKLTNYSSLPIWVNFDLVRYILPASQGTWLHFTNEERWLIQETPEQILELMK